jgi:hypothetical protein
MKKLIENERYLNERYRAKVNILKKNNIKRR